MLNYIKKTTDNKLYISSDNEIDILDCTFQKYINLQLTKTLTNLQSREQTTKRVLGFSSKIPLYIGPTILLICMKSYRLESSLYINYHSIKSCQTNKNNVIITFLSNHCIKLNQKHSYMKQLEKCNKILDYLE